MKPHRSEIIMRFRKTREEDPGIMIAPFIDMVFLLLIFFMVTSRFDVASGVSIQLPKVATRTFDERKDKITLIIDRPGHLYLKGAKTEMNELGKRLRSVVEEKGLINLVLQADKDVPHGIVVEAMDIAKTAGVHSIIIAAQWKAQKVL